MTLSVIRNRVIDDWSRHAQFSSMRYGSTWKIAVCLALGLCAGDARASGRVTLPDTVEAFPSHAACRARLQTELRLARSKIASRRRVANGQTREVALSTRGIEAVAPDETVLEYTLWYHHGRAQPQTGKTETTHSFERRTYICRGRSLHIASENGFTQPTYDDTRGPRNR